MVFMWASESTKNESQDSNSKKPAVKKLISEGLMRFSTTGEFRRIASTSSSKAQFSPQPPVLMDKRVPRSITGLQSPPIPDSPIKRKQQTCCPSLRKHTTEKPWETCSYNRPLQVSTVASSRPRSSFWTICPRCFVALPWNQRNRNGAPEQPGTPAPRVAWEHLFNVLPVISIIQSTKCWSKGSLIKPKRIEKHWKTYVWTAD